MGIRGRGAGKRPASLPLMEAEDRFEGLWAEVFARVGADVLETFPTFLGAVEADFLTADLAARDADFGATFAFLVFSTMMHCPFAGEIECDKEAATYTIARPLVNREPPPNSA